MSLSCSARSVFLALLFVSTAPAQELAATAPYRPSEVVVQAELAKLGAFPVAKVLPRSGLVVVQVPPGDEQAYAQLLTLAGYPAAVNRIATRTATVNDPFASFQWHFANVQANDAWDLNRGAGVTVAVLDTGLATGGTDGIGCVVAGRDVVNGDNDPQDGDGHGTHVSGTIGQASNNATGVAGLAYECCIMPVKVLSDTGSGSFADIAEGIYWAVDHGAQVINMSLGINARFGVTNDPVMDPALNYAYTRGVTVVCAAGNDGYRRNVSYPAIYPTTIAVGATDYANAQASYSNRGTGLDIMAPGGNLGADLNGDGYGDGVLQETRVNGSWGYYFFDGTSMASPHVAAVAALLISHGTATTPDAIRAALTGTALDLGAAGYDTTYGHGLVQAFAALGGGGGGGGCTDADGDGWCVENGDCNDADPNVYPGANDTKGRRGRDGIDNDCNGIIDG